MERVREGEVKEREVDGVLKESEFSSKKFKSGIPKHYR